MTKTIEVVETAVRKTEKFYKNISEKLGIPWQPIPSLERLKSECLKYRKMK